MLGDRSFKFARLYNSVSPTKPIALLRFDYSKNVKHVFLIIHWEITWATGYSDNKRLPNLLIDTPVGFEMDLLDIYGKPYSVTKQILETECHLYKSQ